MILIIISWCVMAITHEMGHIVCGWSCGGKLLDADLLPWHMPYSFFEPDPAPLVTLWGGPILGVVVPVMLAAMIRKPFLWFIADFCLLANGAYIAVAWFTRDTYLDTTKLLEHGASPVSIGIYCALTIGFGYAGIRHHCSRIFGSKTMNMKGIGEGIKKNAEETSSNASKGAVKGAVEGVKETIKDALPFRKKSKSDSET